MASPRRANGSTSRCWSRYVITMPATPRPCSPSMRWWTPSTKSRARPNRRPGRDASRLATGGLRARLVWRDGPAGAAQFRPRADQALSLHPVAAHRIALPASADLLGICRRGDRAAWPVGGRLDGARAHPALPPVGNRGARFRSAPTAGWGALVSAVALRSLAGHQRPRLRAGALSHQGASHILQE